MNFIKSHLIVLALFFSPLLFSQEEEKGDTLKYGLEEVTVVGTRTKEKIIDIPYSVFSVEKKELAYGKKVSARNVLADVPGLFLQSRYGNQDLRVSIRGFGNRSNTGIRGVRILQDGIPESEPDGETVIDAVDFTSLAGVEVVKGNLSSLYANAPGGVIDFKTDYYFADNFAATFNQVGKFGFRQNGFKVGLKNSENRFFLSYYYRNLDGYRKHSEEYQHLVNAIYEGYLGNRSSITLLGNFVDGFNRLPGPLTKTEYETDPFMSNPLATALDFRRMTKKGRLAVKYSTGFGDVDENELEITAYGGIKELTKTDNELFVLSTRYSLGTLIRYANRGHIADLKNTFTAGMDYAFQSGPINAFENTSGVRGVSVQNSFDASVSNVGFYFLDHLDLIENKLGLFLSSRYDISKFKRDIYIPFGSTDSARVFSGLTPKIGINYKLLREVAVYSSYGVSYDFPALSELDNNLFTTNSAYTLNPDLDPQRSKNFEVGVKGNIINREAEFMRKVTFDVTFFHYIISDAIVPFNINQQVYLKNAAKTKRTGIEIGLKTHPFEETELLINYTYTKFKYDTYLTENYTPTGSTVVNYSGNFEPSVPQQIVNFIFNYEFEINDDISGLLQWDCDYIEKIYVDDANSETAPSFFYGNIMAGITYQSELFSTVFYTGVYNIFNKRYVGFVNINDYFGRYYETGEPRSFYAGLNVNFKF
ncbi:MAG: TonB-dependent receptor [Ignavibacteriales bacterium]|nr:MAG: TonB-dependent receptor [Ignavibacteriales bacterium]